MKNRRDFLQKTLGVGAGLAAAPHLFASQQPNGKAMDLDQASHAAQGGGRLVSVVTPDIPQLPWRMVDGAKEFRLIAEPVERQISPWKTLNCWGYNGSSPGPTLQASEGDRVRVIVDNHLPESTSMHWHGFEIPLPMDGIPYISQQPIPPGGRFVYEFTLHQNGTFFYHSHGAMQEMMGMIGLFILHPKSPHQPQINHDFGIVLQEWALLPNQTVPNSANMESTGLRSMASLRQAALRCWSAKVAAYVSASSAWAWIIIRSISTGTLFKSLVRRGGRIPEGAWWPGNTVLVGVAQARDIEFVANNPGDWMLHCHLPHHMMNNMMDLMGDRMMNTADQTDDRALMQMQTLADTVGFEHIHHAPIADKPNEIKGFPQDAFMDMAMDEAKTVAKPENTGLAQNWSAMMMGMMSLIRVLPSYRFDQIAELVKQGKILTPEKTDGRCARSAPPRRIEYEILRIPNDAL